VGLISFGASSQQALCRALINFFPPLTDAITDAVLQPIYRMRDKSLTEFHITAPDHIFRLFRRAENPPYTSISVYHQVAIRIGCGGDVWHGHDPIEWGRENGEYYPIYD
jgi:hypothetical protein